MSHMASTSRSPGVDDSPLDREEGADSHLNPKHPIFLSHCGEQKAFVEQLYEDLKSHGQSPFFDQCPESLPKGEVFANRIFEAARNCVVAVVVLSKEFLESKWTMLELSTFVEAQKTVNPKLKLFPLFYKLEASDLKEPNITRVMARWTEMADADGRILPDVWKDAVRVLAGANGEVFSKYGGSEVRYRKAIVDAVCRLCRRYVAMRVPSMVGRDRLCNIMKEEFEKLEAKRGFYEARILGLYGTGGMGKTFICKALCDHFSDEYSGRVCYVECWDGAYLDLLKLILEELTDIDKRALQSISNERQANDFLKRFLPRQDVFLVLDNLEDDHLDWPLLTYLSANSKVVVTSRSLGTVQRVVGSHALCLPCPTLTEPEAVQLFVRSAGCTQPLIMWTNEQLDILKKCLDLSFFNTNLSLDNSHSSEILLQTGGIDPLVLDAYMETGEEIEMLEKVIQLSLSESDSMLSSDPSYEKLGHYNPLVLVVMGTTIKESYAWEPMQLINKCQRIEFLQHHERRALSDVLKTKEGALTADEKLLFLDVALFYPIMNLGDVEFVDMLDRVLKWLETVDGSPRREILLKLGRLKYLNDAAVTDPRKVHVLFPNIYTVLAVEGAHNLIPQKYDRALPCLDKAFEILTLQGASLQGADIGRDPVKVLGTHYMLRGMARKGMYDFRRAAEDFEKANTYYPNHPKILQCLGSVRLVLDQYQEGLDALNRAITLYPTTEEGVASARQDYADAFAMRSYLRLRLSDPVGAKLDIDFGRALGPNGDLVRVFYPIVYKALGLST